MFYEVLLEKRAGKISPLSTKALDNNPALKGGQSRLPDELQSKIINSKNAKRAISLGGRLQRKMTKVSFASANDQLRDFIQMDSEKTRERMNKNPWTQRFAAGLLGAGIGAGVGKARGFNQGKHIGQHALIVGGGLAAANELERRYRNHQARKRGLE